MAEYLSPEDFEIAAKNGIPEERVKNRFYYLYWSKERAITQPCKSPKGLWPKYKDKCAETGISESQFYKRMRDYNMTPEEAATTKRMDRGTIKKVNVKVTKEVQEIAAKNGIGVSALKYRVNYLKWPVERAMTEPIHERKRRKGTGEKERVKVTKEVQAIAAKNGISLEALRYRVNHLKWPVSRAMTEPIQRREKE